MKSSQVSELDSLIAAYLRGETPTVPASLQAEFDRAMAAHAALNKLMCETEMCEVDGFERRPPALPDEFTLEREIGRGGMGIVYLARQRSLNRHVALKVLRPGERTLGPQIQRFLGEARHLARLRHPNIVSIHEVGDAKGEPFFTMDYIEGRSLAAEIAQGSMPPARAVSILKQIAAAVQHAHQQGIVHRDLKPSNVLLDDAGNVFVTDFGLARDISHESNLTQSGELLGTPQYMAPEQARGQGALIGEATDIHALGLILFEMLTGRAAFVASSPADVLVRLLNEDVVPLRALDPRIPRDLETMCEKMLRKEPEARYSGVSALLEDVRRFETGEPLLARRTGPARRIARWMRRHQKTAVAMAVTALATLTLSLALGPSLFDKSREELVAWGDELHKQGKHEQAVTVYRRALADSTGQDRRSVLDAMVRCCGEMGNTAGLVEAATTILNDDPLASFGKHDYLVAQAVYQDLIRERPHLLSSVNSWSAEDFAELEFVARRYELFVNGPYGTAAQREAAAQRVSELHALIDAQTQPPQRVRATPDVALLPTGSTEELVRQFNDTEQSRWQRGKAAYAAGIQSEAAGELDAARQFFEDGYRLMKADFPTYSGITTRTLSSASMGIQHIESPACHLLREAFAAVQRLDPERRDELQGGLQIRMTGVNLPATFAQKLRIELVDPSAPAGRPAGRSVPKTFVFEDQVARLGIADGRYQMSVTNGGASAYGDSVGRISGLLHLDLSKLPKQIEIVGDTLEFEVPGWLDAEIALLEPALNATVDLRSAFFRWTAVEGADHYQLTFIRMEEQLGRGTAYRSGTSLRVPGNSVTLSTLTAEQQREASWLTAGMKAIWQVQAFDKQGERIGSSVQGDRSFLVGNGLSGD